MLYNAIENAVVAVLCCLREEKSIGKAKRRRKLNEFEEQQGKKKFLKWAGKNKRYG